ncbi:hypothetical protein K431DRAFT_224806 [Polychaeton citri CBS 116435]|uniref:Uncharacterized protein n=1 Tax=Polychaeton citri CBS 116435 TaxID=1314669 RepID=A0A9P4Q7Z6_9PEZI|nr:hypothetical protein K431DRAFT_224806 [Polychaeton citri CBS 116435]
MATSLRELTLVSKHVPDCCAGLSRPLIDALVKQLPDCPALALSVGCGSGLLESMVLDAAGGNINLRGVEVASCVNIYLPEDRFWPVQDTRCLHDDAMLASALMFVYPRQAKLVCDYIEECRTGALETLLWLGPKCDWPEYSSLLQKAFSKVEIVGGNAVADNEILAVAAEPLPG